MRYPGKSRWLRLAFACLMVVAGQAAAGSAFRDWVDLRGTSAELFDAAPKAGAEALAAGGIGPLTSDDLAGMRVQYVHSPGEGPGILSMRREIAGIPVYGERALLVLGPKGVPRDFHANLKLRGKALEAARADAKAFNWPEPPKSRNNDADRWWVAVGDRLVPAYGDYETGQTSRGAVRFGVLRSAVDGSVLRQVSLTDRAAFGYRVYADAEGRPYDNPFGHTEPHPTGVPDGSEPSGVADQNLVFVEGLSGTSGVPWLPADATETVGNHADVFFNSLLLPDGSYDFLFSDGPGNAWGPGFQPADGDFRAQSVDRNFDYVYDHSIAPSDFFQLPSDPDPAAPDPGDPQLNAKIVQAFYMANYLHDFFYDAGFDEAAGNAQMDNFGRGGDEGDPMIVHAGSQTTVIYTPGDGESPVLTLGLNNFTGSNKDFGLDWTVFTHEWTHYMVRRLVGGGTAFLENNQGRSVNEGWADLVGVFMSTREEDMAGPAAPGLTSSYAVGGYGNRDYTYPVPVIAGTAPADSHFYGIRRWPFGPSNPFTFRHIEHGVPLPGPASDFYDWKARSRFNSEVHTAGEVWAAAVWDCFREIYSQRDDREFAANRSALARYIVTGMMATPPNPTFTEARDGVLTAMRAADRDDYDICRSAFADRGLGAGAVAPDRFASDHAGVVESFDAGPIAMSLIETRLDDSIRPVDGDGILDNIGEVGRLTVVMRNSGFETIRRARLAVPSTSDYRVLLKRPRVVTNIAPGEDVVATFPLVLTHRRDYDDTRFTLHYDARGGRGEHRDDEARFNHRTHFDMEPGAAGTDRAEFAETLEDWRVESDRSGLDFTSALANPTWERVERADTAGNHSYRIGDRYAGFDVSLVSPSLDLRAEPGVEFEIAFDHAFNFRDEVPPVGTVPKGEARVEISDDGGETWSEVASFTGESAGYPALAGERVNLGTGYAGSSVEVRFRLVSGATFQPVDQAWLLDNIKFQGLAQGVFTRIAAENGR